MDKKLHTGLYSRKARNLLNVFINSRVADADADAMCLSTSMTAIIRCGYAVCIDTNEVCVDDVDFCDDDMGFADFVGVRTLDDLSRVKKQLARFVKRTTMKSFPESQAKNAGKWFTSSAKTPPKSIKCKVKTSTKSSQFYGFKEVSVALRDAVLLHDILAGSDLSKWSKEEVDAMLGHEADPVNYELVKSADEEIAAMKRSRDIALADIDVQMSKELKAARDAWRLKKTAVAAEWSKKISEASKIRRAARKAASC